MAWLSIEQMREEILRVYPGDSWRHRVMEMPDRKVAAIYRRMLCEGILKESEKKKLEVKPADIPVKKPENRFGNMVGEQLKFDI